MIFQNYNPRQRRFLLLTFGLVELFFISMASSIYYFDTRHPVGGVLYGMTAVLVILLLASVAMLVRWVAVEMDEFQRSVLVRALLWGVAGTCAICGVWMVLERSVPAAHMPMAAIPLVFLFSSLAAKFAIKFGYR